MHVDLLFRVQLNASPENFRQFRLKVVKRRRIHTRRSNTLNLVKIHGILITIPQMEKAIKQTKKLMEKAAKDLDFMEAARLRDEMFALQKQLEEMKR